MKPVERIQELLADIYGPDQAASVWSSLSALIEQQLPLPSPSLLANQPLSEKDAILITYADLFQRAGEPHLRTLHHFLKSHLPGVFSGLHLLPFYPYSSDDGFSVIDYFQVDPPLGTWKDLNRLGQDHRLMFDAVINHVSQESAWFQAYLRGEEQFQEYFISPEPGWDLSQVVRPRTTPLLSTFDTAHGPRQVWTTFGRDQVDLNYAHPQVLLQIISLLLFYIRQGASLLRLDAIAYLWKASGTTCIHLPQTHSVVKLVRAVLDWVAPHVLLITETNVPHEENISYFGQACNGSTDEAQLVYQFPLAPLILHTFLAGDCTKLSLWARSLSAPGLFFNFTASHDGIGVQPARGLLSNTEIDRLVVQTIAHQGQVSYKANPDGSQSPYELNITWYDALNNPAHPTPSLDVARFLASQAIMLSLAGVPGVFVHSLFGSRSCQDCYTETGRARSLNREKFDLSSLEARLEQPGSPPAQVLAGFRRLLETRARCPAFHPSAPQVVYQLDPAVFSLLRTSQAGEQKLLCLVNVTPQSQRLPASSLSQAIPGVAHFRDTLSTKEFTPGESGFTIEPFEVLWLTPYIQ